MKKITNLIVEKRNFFLILFVILAGISLYLSTKVNINEDIMAYLPKSSETKIGYDIMNQEFSKQDTSILNIMFKDLANENKEEIFNKLKNIEGVSGVDYEDNDKYNIDEYTLFVLNVDDYADSSLASDIYTNIEENFDYVGMSGSIYDANKPILQISIVIIAIVCAMIILVILSESYIEPFLYLITIGIAVFINKGTNIIFGSVSSITDSITAILQLALSMDYSIMLSNRFKQEKETTNDKVKAMKNALYQSFKAISSSSITTIVGLLALIFMSFTIGRDLGLVLSKGVLLSLICIFVCLPALLLLFDNLIAKTHKKSPHFNLTKLGIFSYKTRWFQTIVIIVLFVAVYFLQGNTTILYTDSEQDKVGEIFSETNQIAIVYENKYEELIANYCKKLEENQKIDTVLCYSNTLNEELTFDELNPKFDSLGKDTTIDEYLIKIIYYNYFNKDEVSSLSVNDFITFIQEEIYPNEKLNDSLSEEVKENLNLLTNFATPEKINQKRSITEIVNTLDINKKDAENISIYYNSKNINTKLTIKEFISFMLNDVAKDPDYSSSLDSKTISELEKLQKFTNLDLINQKMNTEELADLFGIDNNLIDQLLLFYRVKRESNTKLTLNEFAKSALSLAQDKEYEDMFDDETVTSLKLLESLSTESIISKKINSDEMHQTLTNFGLNLSENIMPLLYTLYDGYNTSSKITISDFVGIAIELANDKEYENIIDKNSLELLAFLLDETKISTKYDSSTMNSIFENLGLNISLDTMSLLYTLYDGYNNITLTLNEFAIEALKLAETPPYSSYFTDDTKILLNKVKYLNEVKDIPMSNEELYTLFNITDEEQKNTLDILLGSDKKTPVQFINALDSTIDLTQAKLMLSDTKYSSLELATILNQNELAISAIYGATNKGSNITISLKDLIKFIYDNKANSLLKESIGTNSQMIDLAYLITNEPNNYYTKDELSTILNQDKLVMSFIYGLYDTKNSSNIDEISVKELINFIYQNKDNSLIASNIGNNTEKLNLAYTVTNNTKTTYNYKDVSKITGTEQDKVKQIYGLYEYQNYDTFLSPLELTDLILDNLNDELLKDKIDNSSLENLNLVKKVMTNTLNNTKVTYSYIGDLLGIDNDTITLLFGLYDFKYIKEAQSISFYNYINFIIKDVMDNKDYSSKFNQDTREKLTTINSIMTRSLNNEKYSSLDLYGTLRVLNKDLDKSLVELVYLYNSSINEYNPSWRMTIEEFINYLNIDILNDSKFNDFIDDEMHNKITDAKESINKAKGLIVSDRYRRVVLNTKYSLEDEETFAFINSLENDLGNNEGIYIVGNSSMAREMSQTFNNELNKITLLTMIFIFVVVAITFKSLLIPFILVLVIQCAVYITMSFISLTGGSVYFISLLIVQAILMGATIDYAIVYTSYYKESRASMNVKASIINAYNKSIHTIISSSSILIIVTLIVANFASAIAAKICETISEGAFASAILILIVLPGVLASCDKIICRKNKV